MKSVLISIQPYWVFLIIAKKMGWNINQEKTVEVRKNYPKSNDWNKVVKIYCTKDKKSFAKIPKEYQFLMKKFLGKVIGEFICYKVDRISHCGTCNRDISLRIVDVNFNLKELDSSYLNRCGLSYCDILEYSKGCSVFGWHISNLVIYDEPKELSEFYVIVENEDCGKCKYYDTPYESEPCNQCQGGRKYLTRPPQSWMYIEE